MSQYNCIVKVLNLKDENISFNENFYSEEIIKGVRSQIYYGTLTYQPQYCYSCGCVFDNQFEKHGFKTSTITLPKVSNMNAYLKLRKQRYKCHHCNSTFTLKTSIVNQHCYISNNTKVAVALAASNKISECDLAKEHNVSHSTVNRVINSFYEVHKPNYNYLPEQLCFDEFKSVKSSVGAMSFLFCDAHNGSIIDIVEDRRLNSLIKYFQRYTKKARRSVKLIVIDMYKPYIQLIKMLFPNAKIVMDKFHIIQLISRSLNKTRVRIMNQDKKNYNKFKRYWKLILKDRAKLDIKNYRKVYCFKQMMCEEDIVNYLLDQSNELRDTYELYQDLLHSIKNKNPELFTTTLDQIEQEYPNISAYMKTSVKSIRKNKSYILNLMSTNYTNGVIEGINNKIKVIKRIAFGYRSYHHFKLRILISHGMGTMKRGLSHSA
ncbi:ISL3 family transposase [Mycoplasmatota bacterium]|nr:ISL3 family transposase [Mycoplasmatota bacterium]